MKSFGGGMCD